MHRSSKSPGMFGACLRAGLCSLLLASLLAGCPEPDRTLREQRELNAAIDLERHTERQLAFTAPLTLNEVVTFAVEHNLEAALQERRNEIERERRTQAWLKLLPQMKADFDYSHRSNLPASTSRNVDTDRTADEYTYSTPRHNMTYGGELLWNLLDFGVSYNLARQATSRAEIAQQELRRTRQNLALNVERQYWRAVVAGHAARMAQPLVDDIDARRRRLQERLDDNTIPQREGLQTKKEILNVLTRLRAFAREEEAAKAELAQLMGLGPNATFELATVPFRRIRDFDRFDVPTLEEEALKSRPELYREDLEESISVDAVHIAALSMLPSPAGFLRHDWDDNPHLKHRHWRTVGMQTSWDLLNIPEQIVGMRIEKMRRELIKQRRTAQAIAILTQVRLAIIEYHRAAESCLESSQVIAVQDELSDVTERLVRQGKANESELLNTRLDELFTRVRYAQAYADLQLGQAQIRNAVGRDPKPVAGPLPILAQDDLDEGQPIDELVRELKQIATGEEEDAEDAEAAIEDGMPKRAVPPQVATLGPEAADRLRQAAERLESMDYVQALEAKHMLIAGGEAGAALALEKLNSYEQRARILAILVVRDAGSARMVASLIPALEDSDPRIRYQAIMALREVFQQNFGYIYDGRDETRTAAIRRWKEFLFGEEEAPVVAPAPTAETGAESPSAEARSEVLQAAKAD
ncbi:MAG: TolC family protein [Planctomycetota bacterium]